MSLSARRAVSQGFSPVSQRSVLPLGVPENLLIFGESGDGGHPNNDGVVGQCDPLVERERRGLSAQRSAFSAFGARQKKKKLFCFCFSSLVRATYTGSIVYGLSPV